MKKTLTGPPDPFTVHPLLAILPRLGSSTKLEGLQSSLFARLERVTAERPVARGADAQRKVQSEQAMLQTVLDWIQQSEGEQP